MSMEKEMLETLKEIHDKWKPQVEKIPQLEKQIGELSGLQEFRENTSKQLESLTQKLDEFSKKPAQSVDREHEIPATTILRPSAVMQHYMTCKECRPELEKWLADEGYRKVEKEERGAASEIAKPRKRFISPVP